jgi:NitT/TauT family transport system ATP-binding protein
MAREARDGRESSDVTLPEKTSGPIPARESAAHPGISVDGVSKTYKTSHGPAQALAKVDFSIRRGEFASIVGPSGCGKSTLLRLISGLEMPSEGSITAFGRKVVAPQTDFGVVFQSPVLLQWRDALQNVLLQAEARKIPRDVARSKALSLLESVGLAGSEHKHPSQLSGGMQQRVSICRALLHDPHVLLMDEPFGAVDALTRDQMAVDLQRFFLGDKTIVFVTHSISEAVFLSDRVIVMTPGPGRIDLELTVDLPRPRRLRVRESREFADYCTEVRRAFERSGVLHED